MKPSSVNLRHGHSSQRSNILATTLVSILGSPVFLSDSYAKHFHPTGNLEKMTRKQFDRAEKQWERSRKEKLRQRNRTDEGQRKAFTYPWDPIKEWDFNGQRDAYETIFADSSRYYDKWQQAYRMLGGYIDCDHPKDKDRGGHGEHDEEGCSRWMMWAAYVDTAYQGGGRYEYLDDDGSVNGYLDCGEEGSSWRLLGVYRQEFYQFLEQISNHLWAINDARYIVALAGLAYMTDVDCTYLGTVQSNNTNTSTTLYAGVQPLQGGSFQIGLYTDGKCIYLDEVTGLTYDHFNLTSDFQLDCDDCFEDEDDSIEKNDDNYFYEWLRYGNDDWNDDWDMAYDDYNIYSDTNSTNYDDISDTYSELQFDFTVTYAAQAEKIWTAAQEYTLSSMNYVFDEFKSCTLCMDWPSYEYGYASEDNVEEDDDLINQCWKFYSHNTFTCEADCIALGAAQGTINTISYANSTFGSNYKGGSGRSRAKGKTYSEVAAEMQRMRDDFLATIFFAASAIMFCFALMSYCFSGNARNHLIDDFVEIPPWGTAVDYDEFELEGENDNGPWYRSSLKNVLEASQENLGSPTSNFSTRGRSTTRRDRDVPESDYYEFSSNEKKDGVPPRDANQNRDEKSCDEEKIELTLNEGESYIPPSISGQT